MNSIVKNGLIDIFYLNGADVVELYYDGVNISLVKNQSRDFFNLDFDYSVIHAPKDFIARFIMSGDEKNLLMLKDGQVSVWFHRGGTFGLRVTGYDLDVSVLRFVRFGNLDYRLEISSKFAKLLCDNKSIAGQFLLHVYDDFGVCLGKEIV